MTVDSLVKYDRTKRMVETLERLPLGEAAKAVRKHPSTLTKAANHKDPERRLPFTLDSDGERLFSIPELIKRFGKVYSPEDDALVNSPVKKRKSPVNSSVRTSEISGDFTSDSLTNLVEIHEVRTSAYEKEVSMLKDANRRLEGEVESWKTQSKSWQNHADNSLRLLTDERTKSEQLQPKIEAEQGGHFWRNTIAASAIIGLVAAAFYFNDDITQQLAKFTAADKSAAAVESVPPKG